MADARVLLIGDGPRLFWDFHTRGVPGLSVRTEVLEGIHAAAQTAYDVVALELRLVGGRLPAALRALRQAGPARIVLLAQMYEEPLARRAVGPADGGTPKADDYLVCPAALTSLSPAVSAGPADALDPRAQQVLESRIRELERLATEDELTGLKNRRYLWEFSRQILEHAAQTQGRVTLWVYDIDDFKQYNDRFGHTVGDRILQEAAILMRRCCRPHDVVGRIGGDEFAVIFWDEPQGNETAAGERRGAGEAHPREAMIVARRFQEALQRSDLRQLGTTGQGLLTISGGLASYPQDGTTLEELFQRADQALLEAKQSGKNRVYLVGQPPGQAASVPGGIDPG